MAAKVVIGDGGGAGNMLFAGDLVVTSATLATGLEVVIGPDLARLVRMSQVAALNLEAPLVDNGPRRAKVGPHFAMPPGTASELRRLGFDVAGLANNHIGDHGDAGVLETIRACEDAGLVTVGAGEDLGRAAQPVSRSLSDGTRVAILAFCEAEFGMAAPGRPGAAPISSPLALDAVRAARTHHDFVVVLAHGGVEEVPLPSPQRRSQLHRFVESGADLVVGHHPHVPQGWERHGNGLIFYSLGDFFLEGGYEMPRASLVGFVLLADVRGGRLHAAAVVPYQRRGDRLALRWDDAPRRLADLAELISDPDSEALWQALAVRIFNERYLPFFARLGASPSAPVRAPKGLRTLRAMLEPMLPLVRKTHPKPELVPPPAGWDALMLENLVRCESHRWTIETAVGVLGRDVSDLRTPEIERRAELLRGMADGV